MKKNYVSPHAECMTFQADAAIAACQIVQPDWPNFETQYHCKENGSTGQFASDSKSCSWFIEDYCYYTIKADESLFGS
ncbi:MAG: hypothetical protein HPZ79_02085 [Oscillospiraceae bacterium]|nr:hypothetical protein [Oscillospiraceae bacterium]